MKLQFPKREISYLAPVVTQVHNLELTQELRVPDGMSRIGRLLGAYGQPVLRSKEWNQDSVQLSGGMTVQVLYLPEEGTDLQTLECWVPFRTIWDLPADTPEGSSRICCLSRFVDARAATPEKIMIRVGIAVMAECWIHEKKSVFAGQDDGNGIELLQKTYPLRLAKEAGEKTFSMDEEISLPVSLPEPVKIIYYAITPELLDHRILANRIVYRGKGKLHLLYCSEEGQLHSWDSDLPFSQFVDLDGSYSADAQADILFSLVNAEAGLDGDGKVHFRCELAAQYLVDDREMITVTEDAYCPGRVMTVFSESISLPVILDNRKTGVKLDQSVSADVDVVVDLMVLPDFPKVRRMEDKVRLEMPVWSQLLCYGENGMVEAINHRWESTVEIPSDPDSTFFCIPLGTNTQAVPSAGRIMLQGEISMQITAGVYQSFEMAAELELGEERTQDPNRPSLILCRAGNRGLWEIGKESGASLEDIRTANGLHGEPQPGQMLLIPVI